jgi:hypothetical protein
MVKEQIMRYLFLTSHYVNHSTRLAVKKTDIQKDILFYTGTITITDYRCTQGSVKKYLNMSLLSKIKMVP